MFFLKDGQKVKGVKFKNEITVYGDGENIIEENLATNELFIRQGNINARFNSNITSEEQLEEIKQTLENLDIDINVLKYFNKKVGIQTLGIDKSSELGSK